MPAFASNPFRELSSIGATIPSAILLKPTTARMSVFFIVAVIVVLSCLVSTHTSAAGRRFGTAEEGPPTASSANFRGRKIHCRCGLRPHVHGFRTGAVTDRAYKDSW